MTSMAHPAQSDIGDISDFVTTTKVTITDVVLALVVLIAAWILARLARRGVRTVLGRVDGISEDLRQLTARVTFYFLLLIGVGVALTFVGAEIQPILTAAHPHRRRRHPRPPRRRRELRSRVILQTRRPIQIGDDIDVLEHSGIVREINGRSVVLEAWDRRRIHIPNQHGPRQPPRQPHRARHAALGGRGPLGGRRSFDDAVAAVIETVANVPGVSPIIDPRSSSAASIRDGW